ncbi:MAG TPA: restriction endonuclease subunit S, partial [Gammaproteobacteria bacterium]|nr:restriction endonuclease subunit S [Gammaproteobacteria bacterium]
AEDHREPVNPLSSPDTLFQHFSIPAFDEDRWPKAELGESIRSLKLRVLPGTILLSKLNPEIERVWLASIEPTDGAICSTEFLVLSPLAPYGQAYIYCLACSPLFRQQIESLVTGTSKSHQRAKTEGILGLPVVLPPKAVADMFDRIASVQLSRVLDGRRESRTLATLRDALLPKLVSGELRVKDAARFAGAAL